MVGILLDSVLMEGGGMDECLLKLSSVAIRGSRREAVGWELFAL